MWRIRHCERFLKYAKSAGIPSLQGVENAEAIHKKFTQTLAILRNAKSAKPVIARLDEVKSWQSTLQKAVEFAIFRNAF